MPFVEERSILGRSKFPVFGVIYLILLALKYFSEAGVRASKPFLMTQELNFSEDFSVITVHSQIAGANIVMLLSNILVDFYSGPYYTFIVQELILNLLAYPLSVAAILGYSSLNLRRILYLTAQGVAVLSAVGSGTLNAFIAEQFSLANYNKFLAAKLYISFVSTCLGVIILPQLVAATKCFQTESCCFIVWIIDWTLSFLILLLFLGGLKFFRKPRRIEHSLQIIIRLWKDGRKEKEKLMKSRSGRWALIRGRRFRSVMEYSRLYDSITRRDASKVWSTWKFFLPLACFWGLISQYNTTWMFQASTMDGYLGLTIGHFELVILPNQVWAVIPFFGLIWLPLIAFWTRNVKFPLRVLTASQIAIAVAFFTASYLESRIEKQEKNELLHMYWAVPQHILASFSEITFIVSYRMFNYLTVPRRMQQVSRNMLIISRILGNILVVIVLVFHYFFDIPSRELQYFSYSILLSAFIVIFILMNSNFDWLLNNF